jgi:phosphate transport system ATP-binding protein
MLDPDQGTDGTVVPVDGMISTEPGVIVATLSEATIAKLRTSKETSGSAAAFDQLARVIRSVPDRHPLNEKIAVRHLNFYYEDGNQALRDVSVPIYANRVTAFVGPSGCGKSTLLRVFNRIYSLYPGQRVEGDVLLDGEDILSAQQDVAVLRTRVGMVFQKPTPFPMSIYDNVAFGIGLNRNLAKAQMDDEVEAALRRVALWDEVKDQLLRSGLDLSGGQQQRLSIARAIAVKPEVLLLDEPCASIDPVSSARIEQTIDELKRDITIIIVTHNLQQAARVSDYAGFMYLGEMAEFGSVRDIFVTPRDLRTQRFVTGRFG